MKEQCNHKGKAPTCSRELQLAIASCEEGVVEAKPVAMEKRPTQPENAFAVRIRGDQGQFYDERGSAVITNPR